MLRGMLCGEPMRGPVAVKVTFGAKANGWG